MTSSLSSLVLARPFPTLGVESHQAAIERARQRARRRRLYTTAAVTVLLGLLIYASVARGGGVAPSASPVVVPARPGSNYDVLLGQRVGNYSYLTHDHYSAAVAVFGRPTQVNPTDPGVCEATWPDQGIALAFRSPSASPCSSNGLAQATWTGATVLSGPWSVDRGLRIGDSWSRVYQLYPAVGSTPPGDGFSVELIERAVPMPHTLYFRYQRVSIVLQDGRIARIDIVNA